MLWEVEGAGRERERFSCWWRERTLNYYLDYVTYHLVVGDSSSVRSLSLQEGVVEAQSAVITEESVLFSCPGTFLLLFSVLDRKPRNLDSNKERIFKPTGASPVAIMMYQ